MRQATIQRAEGAAAGFRWYRRAGLAGALCLALTTCGPDDSREVADDELQHLRALGYVTHSDQNTRDEPSGVLIHDRERSFPGYNLYASRTAPEALLLDMEGRVAHSWSLPSAGTSVWERPMLLPDGDLIVIHKFVELLRLAWTSKLRWSSPMRVHHDFAVREDGSIYALVVDRLHFAGLPVYFDSLVRLNRRGLLLEKWSTREHLDEIGRIFDRRSFLEELLAKRGIGERGLDFAERQARRLLGRPEHTYDHFHWNTLNILPATPAAEGDLRFRAGNLLVCFRNVNQIGVLDRDSLLPVWSWGEGILEHPHHPTMLPDGNILVFDNGVRQGRSRVLEIEPATGRVVWQYQASPPEAFFTREKGSAERLPNGNTLICEGDRGRSFEVTPAGEIVWEWRNPEMQDGRRASLYRMQRIPAEHPGVLLD